MEKEESIGVQQSTLRCNQSKDKLAKRSYTYQLFNINKIMEVLPINPDLEQKRAFLQVVANCNWGISSSLQDYFTEQNIDLKTASIEEIDQAIESIDIKELLHPGIFNIYNIKDSNGDFLLPNIYTSIFSKDNKQNIYALEKYCIQAIDIINSNGKVLLEDAYTVDFQENGYIIVLDHKMKYTAYVYNPASEELDLVYHFGSEFEGYFEFHEGYYFHAGRFLNESFEYIDVWFDNGGIFSEGYAPVALNGKWGYINSEFEMVVPCQYGDAHEVLDGKAKVFKLKPPFDERKGYWAKNFFDLLIPLGVLRGSSTDPNDLVSKYHCFSEGVEWVNKIPIQEMGDWVEVDISTVIDTSTIGNFTITVPITEIEQGVKDDWIEKIRKEALCAHHLPDELFMDKVFVLEAIEANVASYKYFSRLYSADPEIREKVYPNPDDDLPF